MKGKVTALAFLREITESKNPSKFIPGYSSYASVDIFPPPRRSAPFPFRSCDVDTVLAPLYSVVVEAIELGRLIAQSIVSREEVQDIITDIRNRYSALLKAARFTPKDLEGFFRACDLDSAAIQAFGRDVFVARGLVVFFKLGRKYVDLCDFCHLEVGCTYDLLHRELIEFNGLCRDAGKFRPADGALEKKLSAWIQEATGGKGDEVPVERRQSLKRDLEQWRPTLEM
jgi:hypothetical protein